MQAFETRPNMSSLGAVASERLVSARIVAIVVILAVVLSVLAFSATNTVQGSATPAPEHFRAIPGVGPALR